MGDAGRARLHDAPPRRAAGRRVRRGDLLRDARARGASGGGAPRLRRPLLPARGRRGSRRRSSLAVPRTVRAGARRAAHARGAGAARGADPADVAAAATDVRPEAPAPHRRGRRSGVAARVSRPRARARARAGARDRAREGVTAPRARRCRVPDGDEVGGGRAARRRSPTTSSATRTSRSRARSRTAC